jgi:hypothetical protein
MKTLKSTSTIAAATSSNSSVTTVKTKRNKLPKSKFTRDLRRERIAKRDLRREIVEAYSWQDALVDHYAQLDWQHYNDSNWYGCDAYGHWDDELETYVYGDDACDDYRRRYGHYSHYDSDYDDDYGDYGHYDDYYDDGPADYYFYDSYCGGSRVRSYHSYSEEVLGLSQPSDDHCHLDARDNLDGMDEGADIESNEGSGWDEEFEPKPVFERPRFSTEHFVRRPGRRVRFKKNKEQRGGNRRSHFNSSSYGWDFVFTRAYQEHCDTTWTNQEVNEAIADWEQNTVVAEKARRRRRSAEVRAKARLLANKMEKVVRADFTTTTSGRKRLVYAARATDVAALNAHIRTVCGIK